MTKPIGEKVREILLANPQGLTVREISKILDTTMDLVIACLRRTYGCYIADYKPMNNQKTYVYAVWCCVSVPQNAQKPKVGFRDEVNEEARRRQAKARKEKAEARAKQQRINAELKAAAKAAKQKPTQPEYKPQKTVWVSVPSWSSVGASA